MKHLFPSLILGAFAWTSVAAGPATPTEFAAGKFIPTFAICYSNAKGARPTEETARFDLLACSASKHAADVWGRNGRNSWKSLKALNPGMVIALYVMGPSEYNTADWGQMGEGWEWLKQRHGAGTDDRWIAIGQ